MATCIKFINAEQTKPLRHTILHPKQTVDRLVFPGDNAPDTVHLGCYVDDQLIGVASLYHEPRLENNNPDAWRLRGMAVDTEQRGKGYGKILFASVIDYVKKKGGAVLWCNARTQALDFYIAQGMKIIKDEFDIPGIGPHYLVEIRF